MDVAPLLNLLNAVSQSEKKGPGAGADPASSIAELIAQFQHLLEQNTPASSPTASVSSSTDGTTTPDAGQTPSLDQTGNSNVDWSLIASLIQFVPLNQFIPTASAQQPAAGDIPQLPATLQINPVGATSETPSAISVEQLTPVSPETAPVPAIPLLLWNSEPAPQTSGPASIPSANMAAEQPSPYPPFLLDTPPSQTQGVEGPQSSDPSRPLAADQLQIRVTSTTVTFPAQQNSLPSARQVTPPEVLAQTPLAPPPVGLLHQQSQIPPAIQQTTPQTDPTPQPTSNTASTTSQISPSDLAQFNPPTDAKRSTLEQSASSIVETSPHATAAVAPSTPAPKTSDLSSHHQRPMATASPVTPALAGQQSSTDLSSSQQQAQPDTIESQLPTDNASPLSASASATDFSSANATGTIPLSTPLTVETGSLKSTPQARAKRSLSLEELLKEQSQQPGATHLLPFGQNAPGIESLTAAPTEQLATSNQTSLQPQTISQITTAAGSSLQEANRIQVELNPHDLGRIRVEVSRHEQQITAKIEVAQSHTHRLLNDSVSQLTDALTLQGITVDRVDITYRPNLTENNSAGSAPQNFSGGARNSSTGQDDSTNRRQPQQEPQQQQFLRRDPPQSQPSTPQSRAARLKDIDIKI